MLALSVNDGSSQDKYVACIIKHQTWSMPGGERVRIVDREGILSLLFL